MPGMRSPGGASPLTARAPGFCIESDSGSAYDHAMRKHTTIDLDMKLVREAGEVLGTRKVTETVHAALDEVVRRRQRLALLDFVPAIELADLDQMRAHRFAETRAPYEPETE